MDPITWIYLIVLVISIAVAYANRPKPQNAKPPALADYGVPTVDEGREVLVLFGEGWVDDPNVLDWGNLRTTPIKAKGGK